MLRFLLGLMMGFLVLTPLGVEAKNLVTGAIKEDQVNQKDRIIKIFNELRADRLHLLDGFYAPDVHFEDPLGVHRGLSEVKTYYARLYKNVTNIEFTPVEVISESNRHVFVWKMTVQAKGLRGGQPVVVAGNSVIHFGPQDLVVYHRDYFDLGDLIYDHLPGLGWVLRQIKSVLRGG